MSAPTKLRGGSTSEVTKLKDIWKRLDEAARDFWRARFSSADTQAVLRQELRAKLKVNFTRDGQLTSFRAWLEDQDARDQQAERMQENERRLTEEHPDWTLDQVREEVLRQSYLETLATGNFDLGLKTRKSDLTEQALKFDQEKFKEGLRTKLDSAMNDLAAHIKGNPKAKAAYEAFKAAVAESTK